VKWDAKGLAVAIAQNVDTGAILMQGFANREALAATISTRKATFYSRSRSSLWTKGETSMNFINVHDIFLDCDRDSVSIFCFGTVMHQTIGAVSLASDDDANLGGLCFLGKLDNIPWYAGWTYMPHRGRDMLLFFSL
jgi:phosphoribosyl-AMP cyclohydrolase